MDGVHDAAMDTRSVLRLIHAEPGGDGLTALLEQEEQHSDGILFLYPEQYSSGSELHQAGRRCRLPMLAAGYEAVPEMLSVAYRSGAGAETAKVLCSGRQLGKVYLLSADAYGQRLAREAEDYLSRCGVKTEATAQPPDELSEREGLLDFGGLISESEIPDSGAFGAVLRHMDGYSVLADGGADVMTVPNEYELGYRGVQELYHVICGRTADQSPAGYITLTPENLLDEAWSALLFD